MDINKALHLAFQHYQQGNLQQAEIIYKEILKFTPNDFRILNNLGNILQAKGQDNEAIEFYQKAIQLNPNLTDAYYNLGTIFQDKKQINEAITYYQKVLQIDPNCDDAYYNIGILLQDKGQLDNALVCYKKSLMLNPNNADTYYSMGNVFRKKGQLDEAISCYHRALQLNPKYSDTFSNLGIALQEKGQLNEAISCYQTAIQLNPNFFGTYNNMGSAFILQGKLKEGICCFNKALQLNPNSTEALLSLVEDPRLSYDDSKELYKRMKKLTKEDMPENALMPVYFAMGKLCENLKIFKESFEYYRLGNVIKRAQVDFNIDSHIHYLSRIKSIFSADFIDHRKSWGSDSEMPIFIFGMPRSGTSLVEQILASHPNVYGGGELQFFLQLHQTLPAILKVNERYPECLKFSNDQIAYYIAELYIKEITKLAGSAKDYTRITDKNPYNFYHLGLIFLLFPRARFIHCSRHPLDTCISIYFQNFSSPSNFSYDLSELGRYYLEYLKIMNHWRKVLPISIFELRYEDVCQQPEEVSRKLIEFCGLDWAPSCLDFYKNKRPVFTASKWQVRQPIYTKSIRRWKNYEHFLGPLKELLVNFI